MRAAIEFYDIVKCYEVTPVLNGLSATIPEGQVTGFLGHNGAGKTTLIKVVLGLIRPTSGTVEVLGLAAGSRELGARVSYLPENVAFYGNLTGQEVLAYLARLKKVAQSEAGVLLERVGLADAAQRPVRTYSKGMRQRLGLAQALLGSPDLLLLDEPTNGLDPLATQQFFGLVDELRSQGRTVVISSHLLGELEPHLDNALILGNGRLLSEGTISQMQATIALPDTICARFSEPVEELLSQSWIACLAPRLREPLSVELKVPAARKMDVMRRLMEIGTLSDIGIKEPTLSQLYAAVSAEEPNGK
jgi:Cu-processing system ATP-binding protein